MDPEHQTFDDEPTLIIRGDRRHRDLLRAALLYLRPCEKWTAKDISLWERVVSRGNFSAAALERAIRAIGIE